MPNYNCHMCNYNTSIKTHFFKHLKTDKHKKTKEEYEGNIQLNIFTPSKSLKNPHFLPQESLKKPQKSSKILKNTIIQIMTIIYILIQKVKRVMKMNMNMIIIINH